MDQEPMSNPQDIEEADADQVQDPATRASIESDEEKRKKEIQEIEAAMKFTCGICYEEHDLESEESDVKFLEQCGHTFCGLCFRDYYQSMIEVQYLHDHLKCPQYGCEVTPTMKDLENIISTNCMSKYNKFKMSTKVAQDPMLIFCATIDCGKVLDRNLHSSRLLSKDGKQAKKWDKNQLSCQRCGHDTCFKCKSRYHEGQSCNRSEKLTSKAVNSNVTFHKCPQCHCLIEKDGGCAMMSCSLCGYSWCWICGFKESSVFHRSQGEGTLCQMFNSAFGFGVKLHWSARFVIAFFGFLFFPVIGACLIIWGVTYSSYRRHPDVAWLGYKKLCLLKLMEKRSRCRQILLEVLLTPVRVLIFAVVLLVAGSVAFLVVSILVLPYYLTILFLLCTILYRFCLMRKRGDVDTSKIKNPATKSKMTR